MRYELSDYEWSVIGPMLPNKPRGVPRVNDRRVLNGIFWVLRSGAPWRDMPESYGPPIGKLTRIGGFFGNVSIFGLITRETRNRRKHGELHPTNWSRPALCGTQLSPSVRSYLGYWNGSRRDRYPPSHAGLFRSQASLFDCRLQTEPRSQRRKTMALQINSTAPDFEAETTLGPIRFYEWLGDDWCILFSHPKDFTPVCTTELGAMARLKAEFDRRACKVIGLSVDPVDSHARWSKDIEETQGHAPNYPMIGDPSLKVSKLYGMLPADAGDTSEGRTPQDNATVRNVFVIGPDRKIKLIISYPMSTGRNFDEVLRALDALQLTAKHKVATPVNWKQGDDVIILASVSDDEAKKQYPQGWKTLRPYLRIVPQPT